jgi:histidinol-phosphate aminotransferase
MKASAPAIAPRRDVALMAGYHSPQLEVDVRLNTNEAPEQPPAEFVAALERAVSSVDLNRYPDREALTLRQALADFHGVEVEQVYCANGSNEVLQSLLLAYGGPGRAIGVFEPTYALHSHIARVTGTSVIEGVRDEQFLVSDEQLAWLLEQGAAFGEGNPAVTFLCSPNNPTGRIEPMALIEKVLDAAPGLVVVDEAYGQFSRQSAIELTEEYPSLVVVRTFSKTWSLAALRLGYAIASPQVIDAMFHVTLPYHLDALKQLAGTIALSFDKEMRARVERLVAERERLLRAFAELPLEVVPSDANFILFKILTKDAKTVWSDLVSNSVLVRDVSSWPRLAGYLRVTVGTPEENDAFLAALRGALA